MSCSADLTRHVTNCRVRISVTAPSIALNCLDVWQHTRAPNNSSPSCNCSPSRAVLGSADTAVALDSVQAHDLQRQVREFKGLDKCSSPRSLGLNSRAVHVWFVVDTMALELVSLRVLEILPTICHHRCPIRKSEAGQTCYRVITNSGMIWGHYHWPGVWLASWWRILGSWLRSIIIGSS